MGIKRQSVQRLVDLLSDQGLLVFQDNPHHRHVKLIGMTATSRQIYQQMSNIQMHWANGIRAELEPSAIESAVALLREFELQLQR